MYRRSPTCGPVTVQDLKDILTAPSNGTMAFPSRSYDEVYPGIIIGDAATALTLRLLRHLRVTHVLNAAFGRDSELYWGCYVRVGPTFYQAAGISLLAVPAEDARECYLTLHFPKAAQFIDDALNNTESRPIDPGGRHTCAERCPGKQLLLPRRHQRRLLSGSSTACRVPGVPSVGPAQFRQPTTFHRRCRVCADGNRPLSWAAVDVRLLRMLGVTGVLNSCYGGGQPYLLDTDTEYYRRRGLEAAFLGLRAADAEWFPLLDWFSTAADFIQRAVRHGRVLVHCVQGLSRSATLVVAYLMIKQHMSVCQALRTVRARREIFPNDGFLQQLCRLNEQLQRRR